MTVSVHVPNEYSSKVGSDLVLKKREFFQLILFILLLIKCILNGPDGWHLAEIWRPLASVPADRSTTLSHRAGRMRDVQQASAQPQ